MKEINYKEEKGYSLTPCDDYLPKSGKRKERHCHVGTMPCQFSCRYFHDINVQKKVVWCKHED
jgi:hypothetical protein